MNYPGKPYSRGPEILRMLYNHGPMSIRGLNRIIPGKMDYRRIADALARLHEGGFVVRRFDSLPKNAGHFYQLSHRKEIRAELAKVVGVPEDQLRAPQIRDQELYHSQACAIWAERFKASYPEARVIRDFQIRRDEEAQNILLNKPHAPDLIPDILIFFPKRQYEERVVIAVEIERSRKSNERVVEKLWRISTQCRLDGVLYVCDYQSITDVYRHLYNTRVREKFLRINYRKNYLMFGRDDYLLFNCNEERTNLRGWIAYLSTTSRDARRDAQFPPSAIVG